MRDTPTIGPPVDVTGLVRTSRPLRRRAMTAATVGLATLVVAAPAGAQEADGAAVGALQVVLDNIWVLVAVVLVLFMQAGFALVEAGLTRAKNVANIMMKNLTDVTIGVLAFAAVGFAIAFGPGNDLFGTSGWFLDHDAFGVPDLLTPGAVGNLTLPTFFVFQVAFAATAATIVSGALAERTRFKAYLVYSLVITAVIYPVVVHWMWGGGWLSQLGQPFGDFAGSTIVHSTGGWAALMGAWIIGPRIGKYDSRGRPRAIPGHSIPFAVIGVLVLFIGWFGFNGGSELAADTAVPWIMLTTTLAAFAGGAASLITIWLIEGKPDVAMTANGVLAGLVSITAGTLTITPFWAVVTGAVGGVLVVFAVLFFDRVARIDDPVGAISVHGVCGAWGTLAVGLFSFQDDAFVGGDRLGLVYGGGADLLVTQAIGVVAVFAWVTVTAGLLFWALKRTIGLRVDAEEELAGLDVAEHGSPGYAPDVAPGDAVARPAVPVTGAQPVAG